VTSRILFEAGYTRLSYEHAGGPGQLPPDGIFGIGVTEQSTTANPAIGYVNPVPRANYIYRALSQYADNWSNPNHWRASASYVTGSHNMRVGYQGSLLINETKRVRNDTLQAYRFNQGIPNQVSVAIPDWLTADTTSVAAFFVQDTWTRGRMTLQGALRYDRAWSWSPAEHNGTTATSPTNLAPITFERTASVNSFNDITPRVGVAYDLFGNGRTALKFNMGHYLDSATNDSAYTRNNPANRISRGLLGSVTRNWSDTDGDRVVDCDLLNFNLQTAQDTCAALGGDNLNFGKVGANLEQVNPDTLRGWGVRENDWQYGVTVQQQILPRMSVEVGYARRWFRGFTVTDNLQRNPSQYDAWTINAPRDARLPGGGGYPIQMYAVTVAANAIPAQNYVTFETDFGPARDNHWDGVDVTLNGRLRQGLLFQVGTSTGRTIEDRCATVTKIDSPDPRTAIGSNQATQLGCRDVDPWQTTLRGLASYTVPKVDVQVSATFRSQPPFELSQSGLGSVVWNVPNTVVQQLLGRLPASALATGTTPVQLLDTDHRMFVGGRRNQVDMRVAKILRFGRTRADLGFDLSNLFNTNYATAYTGTYQYSDNNALNGGTFLNPTSIYTPRFVRLNATFDF
jgi:hypothetical protein